MIILNNVSLNVMAGSTFCFKYEGKYYIYELERLVGLKHYSIMTEANKYFFNINRNLLIESKEIELVFNELIDIIRDDIKDDFEIDCLNVVRDWMDDSFLTNENNSHKYKKDIAFKIKDILKCKSINHNYDHHYCHAFNAFYQSGFDNALILSHDGSGISTNQENGTTKYWENITSKNSETISCDQRFCLYIGSKDTGILQLANLPYFFGHLFNSTFLLYNCLGVDIDVVNSVGFPYRKLSLPGIVMGLAGYGRPNISRKNIIKKILSETAYTLDFHKIANQWKSEKYWDGSLNWDTPNEDFSFDFQDSSDFSLDFHDAWVELLLEILRPFVRKFQLPIIHTGGCALSIILNQALLDEFKLPVFIPPNPDDRGNSLGALFQVEPPEDGEDIVYRGFDILDKSDIEFYKNRYKYKKAGIKEVVKELREGKIVGIIHGRSEVGPRALGNRSIICDPSFPNMKNILNKKVKYREFFRPFAPVVRYEDRDKYFNFTHESPYMSFSPMVKLEYWDRIPAIVHADKTARLQTVKNYQHPLFYSIMTEMENVGSIPIILNTSFNTKGGPIITRLRDAFKILDETDLDYVFYNGKLFYKY